MTTTEERSQTARSPPTTSLSSHFCWPQQSSANCFCIFFRSLLKTAWETQGAMQIKSACMLNHLMMNFLAVNTLIPPHSLANLSSKSFLHLTLSSHNLCLPEPLNSHESVSELGIEATWVCSVKLWSCK